MKDISREPLGELSLYLFRVCGGTGYNVRPTPEKNLQARSWLKLPVEYDLAEAACRVWYGAPKLCMHEWQRRECINVSQVLHGVHSPWETAVRELFKVLYPRGLLGETMGLKGI